MNNLDDFEYEGSDDDSFKSAVGSPLAGPFTLYSHSVITNPMSLQIDVSSEHSGFEDEFEDALSEYYSDDDDDDNSVEIIHADETREHIDEVGDENVPRPRSEQKDASISASAAEKNESATHSPSKAMPRPLKKRPIIRSLVFNQDRDCIAIATSAGFQIQTIDNVNGKSNVHTLDIRGGTNCIQILHRTSLLAIAKSKTPRILSLIHARNGSMVKELSFTSAVRRIEMNKLCMVVLTASGELHVFAYSRKKNGSADLEFLIKIEILHESESPRMMTAEGATMQGAFFDLTSHLVNGCAWLVTKSKDGVGFLSVYKIACGALDGKGVSPLATIELVRTFSAHDHGIARIAIGGVGSAKESDKVNNETDPGLYFATASLQGTIIRVFHLINCDKLYELQRGSSSCVIHSMAFNGNASLLAVSGSKGTIHLFHLNKDNQVVQGSSSHDVPRQVGIAGYMKRFTSNSNNDGQIVRSFARLRLKGEHSRKSNTITVLDSVQEVELEENIAIGLGNGTLLQYAVRYNGKKRPIRAEDLLFHTDSE